MGLDRERITHRHHAGGNRKRRRAEEGQAREAARGVSTLEQNSVTRNLLARLDIAILDLEEQQKRVSEIERKAQEQAAAFADIRARLLVVRDELRPILDSSAPKGVN
jgi:hypothetical protein